MYINVIYTTSSVLFKVLLFACKMWKCKPYWTSPLGNLVVIPIRVFSVFTFCVFLFVCLFVGHDITTPKYSYGEGRGGPCGQQWSSVHIFYFGIVMSFRAPIIIAVPLCTIKWSSFGGFWCSGYQNNCYD